MWWYATRVAYASTRELQRTAPAALLSPGWIPALEISMSTPRGSTPTGKRCGRITVSPSAPLPIAPSGSRKSLQPGTATVLSSGKNSRPTRVTSMPRGSRPMVLSRGRKTELACAAQKGARRCPISPPTALGVRLSPGRTSGPRCGMSTHRNWTRAVTYSGEGQGCLLDASPTMTRHPGWCPTGPAVQSSPGGVRAMRSACSPSG